jgi:plastocyanin
MARIILFGSAVVGVLLATLVFAVWSGQYEAEQPSPSAVASGGSVVPGPSPSAAGSAGASAVASASVQAQPSATASGAETTVDIAKLAFGPDVTVAAGTTVTWKNGDTVPHTATEGSNGVKAPNARFDVQLPVGQSGSFTFADAGTYQVTCTIHPTMNMTVTVQ